MKKIVIINQSANYLMADIAEAFLRSGRYEDVVLLAGNPEAVGGLVSDGIRVDSFCRYVRTSMKSRIWSWIRGFAELVRKIRKEYGDYELFLVSNPATVVFLYIFVRNPYRSLTYDLYPDGFLPSGKVSADSLLYRLWAFFDRQFFKRAEAVYCITGRMAEAMSAYISRDRVEVVPLWGNDRIPVVTVPRDENRFLSENGLQDKFIVMYSGNMGQGHDLSVLIDAADRLRDLDKLRILFVGDGYLKEELAAKVRALNLEDRCLFFPWQPADMLQYSLSCPDISVVSIHRKSVSMPSKTFDLIRMGKPLLGIAEPSSSLCGFIRENGIGEVFNHESAGGIADFIRRAYSNPASMETYREQSLRCSRRYTKELAERFIGK